MSAQAAPPEPRPLAAQRVENRERFRAILCRVIDVGANLVESIDPGPQAEPSNFPSKYRTDAAHAYHHVARDIRQGIMLADKLATPIPEPRPASPIASAEPVIPRPRPVREAGEVIRGEAAETLERESLEWLDPLEPAEELDDRPAEHIIADICQTFGLGDLPLTGLWQGGTDDATRPAFRPAFRDDRHDQPDIPDSS